MRYYISRYYSSTTLHLLVKWIIKSWWNFCILIYTDIDSRSQKVPYYRIYYLFLDYSSRIKITENKIRSIFKLREERQNLPDNRDTPMHPRRAVITRACKYFRHRGGAFNSLIIRRLFGASNSLEWGVVLSIRRDRNACKIIFTKTLQYQHVIFALFSTISRTCSRSPFFIPQTSSLIFAVA